jgi:leader peptidase (prepilin peptidase)/N-methyltransferase
VADGEETAPFQWRIFRAEAPSRLTVSAVVGLGLGLALVQIALHGWDFAGVVPLALLSASGPLSALVDARERRIPDLLSLPLAGASALALAVHATVLGDWSTGGRALLGMVVLTAVFFVLAIVSRGDFGLGDVKLGATLGACLGAFGWMEIVWGVFLGFLLALAWALATLVVRRFRGQRTDGAKTTLPLGPFLVIAGILMGMLLSA